MDNMKVKKGNFEFEIDDTDLLFICVFISFTLIAIFG